MKENAVSDSPRQAPANFQELEPQVILSDGDGLWLRWHGSGLPSKTPCGDCNNVDGNKTIYHNWGFSYPNGNSWNDEEILCGKCGKFTSKNEFKEG